MYQIYRYSRFHYFGLLILSLVGILLVKGFLSEAFPIENYTYSLLSVLLVVFLIGGIIQYWRNIALKVITDPNRLIISKPFKSIKLKWEEISEFGNFRRVVPPLGGNWIYYVKDASRKRKIVIGARGLQNIDELVLCIFLEACAAKIVNFQEYEKIGTLH